MKCRYFCRLPLDISPVYLTRGISHYESAAFFVPKKIFEIFSLRGLKNESSRCLPIEEILLLCLERGEFLKKCGNFAGKFSKGKVMSEYTQSVIQTERDL